MSIPVLLLMAAAAQPAGAPPPPPVAVSLPRQAPNPRTQVLVAWTPGEVRCAGAVVSGGVVRRPLGNLSYGEPRLEPTTYRFAIDASGRPLSLAREGAAPPVFSHDAGPALAASRFPEGSPRQECRVTYTPKTWDMSLAPVEDLVSYTITPTSTHLPKEGWERIRTGGTCANAPSPEPLLRAFPDFRRIAGTPGVKDWALVGYDTDRNGTPVRMRTVHGTGNDALDEAAKKAVGDSRFTEGARTGCLYPYWKAPAKLVAPPVPDEAAFRPEGSNCPAKPRWSSRPVLFFPEPWRRRAIEGWAIVSYDVAPWGVVGNVKMLAAQPSDDFGRQAIEIVKSGRAIASPQGATGCVETVRFVMGRNDDGRNESGRNDREPSEDAIEIF